MIDLGEEGIAPLEVRFLHDPKICEGFVGCAVNSTVYRFYKKPDGTWTADKVIKIPVKKVEGFLFPQMSGTLISYVFTKCNNSESKICPLKLNTTILFC